MTKLQLVLTGVALFLSGMSIGVSVSLIMMLGARK